MVHGRRRGVRRRAGARRTLPPQGQVRPQAAAGRRGPRGVGEFSQPGTFAAPRLRLRRGHGPLEPRRRAPHGAHGGDPLAEAHVEGVGRRGLGHGRGEPLGLSAHAGAHGGARERLGRRAALGARARVPAYLARPPDQGLGRLGRRDARARRRLRRTDVRAAPRDGRGAARARRLRGRLPRRRLAPEGGLGGLVRVPGRRRRRKSDRRRRVRRRGAGLGGDARGAGPALPPRRRRARRRVGVTAGGLPPPVRAAEARVRPLRDGGARRRHRRLRRVRRGRGRRGLHPRRRRALGARRGPASRGRDDL